MREREVYPNAPIVLMVVEVRHTACEPLDRMQVAKVSDLVRDVLPLPGELNEMSVEIQAGPGSAPMHRQTVATSPRWATRDRRTALTVRHNSLTLETTQYGSYERVRALLEQGLQARIAAGSPSGVERIGLRYIDEIRVPAEHGNGRPSWEEWVDPVLLGPANIGAGLERMVNEGAVVFANTDNRAVLLRYGAQDELAVQSSPDLRRPVPPPGPLFKLDIDSFWQPGDEVPEFSVDAILAQADALHEPVRDVFESLITERLREEVLRHG